MSLSQVEISYLVCDWLKLLFYVEIFVALAFLQTGIGKQSHYREVAQWEISMENI
jgi:hypothetical protein